MFDNVDVAITNLLAAEEPFIKAGQVDVSFEQPRREWSQRLLRPTVNFYLCDLAENARLRPNTNPVDLGRTAKGKALTRRAPARVDLHYLVTAWAATPSDEHRLLARIMRALLKNLTFEWEHLPPVWLEQWQDEEIPLTLSVAQDDASSKAAELWGVLGNDMRPSFRCVVTAPLRLDDTVREEELVREVVMNYQPESSPVQKSRADRKARATSEAASSPVKRLDKSSGAGGTKSRGAPDGPMKPGTVSKDDVPDIKVVAAVSLIAGKPMLDLEITLVEWNEQVKAVRFREPIQAGPLRDPNAWEAARWREADARLFNLTAGKTYTLRIRSKNHPARDYPIHIPAVSDNKTAAKDALVIHLD